MRKILVSMELQSALEMMGFPAEDMDKIGGLESNLQVRRFRDGGVLMREGEEAREAFVILSGKAEVFNRVGGRGDVKRTELGPGSITGEMSVLTGFLRSATVAARGELWAFLLTAKDFEALLGASPGFKSRITELVRQRRTELGLSS